MKERIERWKLVSASGNPEADAYLKEITAQAKNEGKIDQMNDALAYLIGEADKHLDIILVKLASGYTKGSKVRL